MGAEVPSLGGVSHIGGEDRRQLRSRNASVRSKDHSEFEASDAGEALPDPLEVIETPVEIVAQPEGEGSALPMGTANGLTLADVKAAYDAS
ncbi:MAG TPA: hypothetical protein VG271_03270 [Beijerinckiaceae bacterium]|jgi:hypothetical protein|nr:hypothetical protein [Beijerinckiaceae bacterium]